MRTWARWTARAALFTASFAAAGVTTVGIASAGTHTTSGNNSILGGNQINAPISIPVNVCGNAAAILGTSLAGCEGGASVTGDGSGGTWTTSGNNSILGGNQVNAPISIPVNVCGNAAALLGTALAGCQGGAMVHTDAATNGGSGGTWTTSGNNSIGGGNQVNIPVRVPVNVCGNSVSAIGTALSGCKGGASVTGGGSGGTWTTSGNNSIVGGNQVNAPISIPVNVCGNAAAVLGGALAGCEGGASVGGGMHTPPPSSGPRFTHRTKTAGHVVRQSAPLGNATSALSGLSSIPLLSGLPVSPSSLTGGGTSPGANLPVQSNLLSYTSPAPAPGMGNGSLLAIAAGAVLAGVATLVAAGRRLSLRKAGR